MIDLDLVVEDTLYQWKKHKNEVVSNGTLQSNWRTIGEVYNQKVSKPCEKVHVIPAQTGTGKTLFTKFYLSHLLAYTDKPALMVVREKVTAQETANDINKKAKKLASNHRGIAIASYQGRIHVGGKDVEGTNINNPKAQNAQILIVTHAQLILAAEDAWRSENGKFSRMDLLYRHIGGDRNLIIIDEEIQLANTHSLSVEKLVYLERRLEDLSSSSYNEKHNINTPSFMEERQKIGYVKRTLNSFENSKKDEKSWVKLRNEFKKTKTICNTKKLAEKLKPVYWDRIMLMGRGNNKFLKDEINEIVQSTLSACDVFTRTWSFWDENERQAKMCNLMMTTGLSTGAVILDATSTVNSSYELLKEESGLIDCEIVPVKQVKNYSNGSLRVAFTKYSGKGYEESQYNGGVPTPADVTNRSQSILNSILKEDDGMDTTDKKILIVTHKTYEDSVKKKIKKSGLLKKYKEIDVSHWGVLDGKNDWSDFDEIFITSLPYLPENHIVDMLMTLIGPDAAYYSEEKVQQIKRELWITTSVSRVIQAINRIGFRRIIDCEGNVKPCKAFVVLPRSDLGNEAMGLLTQSLDGIQVVDWDYGYKTTKTKPRSGVTPREKFLKYLSGVSSLSKSSLNSIASKAGIPWCGSTSKSIKESLLTGKDQFYKDLKKLGIAISVEKKSVKTYIYLSK